MGFSPDITERLARARADLRMGVPVVLEGGAIVLATETLSASRLAALRAMGDPVLAVTARRAETLKARAYDGDLARIRLPQDASLAWVQAVADPADDLRNPMKGPLQSERDGSADLHRAAIALAKSARLLPAALVLISDDALDVAASSNLTTVLIAASQTKPPLSANTAEKTV